MGLFEWIAERFNPGPVGTLKQNEDEGWQPPSRFAVWLITLVGLGLAGFFSWAILTSERIVQWSVAFAVYLVLASYLSPKPDNRNMGWLGGLMNNPFRISDNINRLLLFFSAFLLPGKLILYAVQTLVNTLRPRQGLH